MGIARELIVNADDFGRTAGINRGIAEAHERGIVTSASLMVRFPAAADAVAWARRHPGLSLGLHFDIGEWVCEAGQWSTVYEVVPLKDGAAVAAELARQVAEFRRLAGRPPTHIDSHQHVHMHEPVRTIAARVASDLSVPLRRVSSDVRHEHRFYGCTTEGETIPGYISPEHLCDLIADVPAGLTELGCHPGHATDLAAPYAYREERSVEVATLCDASVRRALDAAGVTLRSFHGSRCDGVCATSG